MHISAQERMTVASLTFPNHGAAPIDCIRKAKPKGGTSQLEFQVTTLQVYATTTSYFPKELFLYLKSLQLQAPFWKSLMLDALGRSPKMWGKNATKGKVLACQFNFFSRNTVLSLFSVFLNWKQVTLRGGASYQMF